ncbi:MAG: hypothetical protein GIW99_05540 [Candidatus Eremiobacteraeota bacterium]|nr:hypothetical protein [Candidatus Eremiobacteraeota bacterium]MBC5827130.1 hypothetical protein [Candidatus Eremiobacteraeota bacterium]
MEEQPHFEYGVLAGESKTRAWLDELSQILNEGWELVHFGPYNPSYNVAIVRKLKEG